MCSQTGVFFVVYVNCLYEALSTSLSSWYAPIMIITWKSLGCARTRIFKLGVPCAINCPHQPLAAASRPARPAGRRPPLPRPGRPDRLCPTDGAAVATAVPPQACHAILALTDRSKQPGRRPPTFIPAVDKAEAFCFAGLPGRLARRFWALRTAQRGRVWQLSRASARRSSWSAMEKYEGKFGNVDSLRGFCIMYFVTTVK